MLHIMVKPSWQTVIKFQNWNVLSFLGGIHATTRNIRVQLIVTKSFWPVEEDEYLSRVQNKEIKQQTSDTICTNRTCINTDRHIRLTPDYQVLAAAFCKTNMSES